MKVQIPFMERFREPLLNGIKICTSRNKRYGQKGDTFEAFEATFKLKEVSRVTLFYVANCLYREEGFQSPTEFQECWALIHPRKGYDENQNVWLHFFELVQLDKTEKGKE